MNVRLYCHTEFDLIQSFVRYYKLILKAEGYIIPLDMERESSSWLKVAIHSPYPLRRNSPDGVSRVIIGLTPHLEQKGCRVRLIGPHIKEEVENLADYTFGRAVKISHDKTTYEMAISFNKRLAMQLWRTVRPDIAVFHEPFVGHAAHTSISGIPRREDGRSVPAIIGHFHAQAEDVSRVAQTFKHLVPYIRRPRFTEFGLPVGLTSGYMNTIINAMDGRIAVSNATAKFWNRQMGGEYEVIYNGIDTEEMNPFAPKIESWNDGRKTIFAAARHDPRKGLEFGIMALNLLIGQGRRDIKLKISGRGKETENLKSLVKRLGLDEFVEFLGILDRKDLAGAYAGADVFISPAIGGEGFGLTLAEALSCGTLVVASDINGYREVMRGLPFTRMVPPKNPKALAEAINNILSLPQEERERLEMQARAYVVGEFSWPRIAGQTVRYYEQCLSEHGRPKPQEWGRKKNGLASKIPVVGDIFVRNVNNRNI